MKISRVTPMVLGTIDYITGMAGMMEGALLL
jgi:hypothetical protein